AGAGAGAGGVRAGHLGGVPPGRAGAPGPRRRGGEPGGQPQRRLHRPLPRPAPAPGRPGRGGVRGRSIMSDETRTFSPGCPPSEDLSALLADALPDVSLATVASHLASCPACAAKLEALGESSAPLLEGLRQAGGPDPLSEAECSRAAELAAWALGSSAPGA